MLERTLEAARLGWWEIDLQTSLLHCSALHRAHYGLPPDAPVSYWMLYAAMVPEDRARVVEAVTPLIQRREAYTAEFRVRWPDGSVHWLRVTGRPEFNGAGQPVRASGLSFEITDQKHAEQALIDSEEQFRTLVEQSPLSIQIVSPEGRTLQVNRAWEEMWGATLDDLIAANYNMLDDPQLEALGIMRDVRRGFAGEVVATPPVLYNRAKTLPNAVNPAEDPVKWVRAVIYPVKDSAGSVRKVVLMHEDVTTHHELERQLHERAAQLAEADRRKDEFLAMLAHELRNPLAPILNAVEIVRHSGGDGDTQRQAMAIIERQARHMGRLLEDLLEVSRITRGKIAIHPQPIDLGEAVAASIGNCRGTIDARRQMLSLRLPEAPIVVHADPTRIEQIVTNLVTNAAKFTEAGGRITITLERDGSAAVLTVRDTGIGIPVDLLPHVFDLFIQADHSLDRAQGGLGIGLTLVRSLVDLHGGSVQACSDGPGTGSTFKVRLPALDPVAPVETVLPVAAPSSEKTMKILVVDDNRDAADSLAEVLRIWGHRVAIAYDGPTALEEADRFQPDALLLDIGLPGMNGYDVAARLRAMHGPPPALIAVSGYSHADPLGRNPFDERLIKPVEPEVLHQALERAAHRRPSPG